MEMPRPGDAHRRLGRLAGSWVGQETIHPTPFDPVGGQATGRMTARMALGGFCLISEYQQERDGVMNFEGHGVFGWDPRARCYTLHWFDSTGVEHGAPHMGEWAGDMLTLMHETSHMGYSRQVYDLTDDGYRFLLQISPDALEWTTFLDGTYRRAG